MHLAKRPLDRTWFADRSRSEFGKRIESECRADGVVVAVQCRLVPGVLAESIRRGTGPAGLIVEKADVNLVAGAIVAAALYGIRCPIVFGRPLIALPSASGWQYRSRARASSYPVHPDIRTQPGKRAAESLRVLN